jgi:hypothetical protein
MSYQATSPDLFSAISSPGSASGALPSDKPDGPTIVPSGPAPAHASLSARQAKALGLMTSGTCGPLSTGSSNSAVLQSSLASRLHPRTASLGSTLYRLTWKRRAMPSGRSIPALRASARRISDSGSTGWPTPNVADDNNTPKPFWRPASSRERGEGGQVWDSAWRSQPKSSGVADADDTRLEGRLDERECAGERASGPRSMGGGLAYSNGGNAGAERQQRGGEQRQQPQDGGAGGVGNTLTNHANGDAGRFLERKRRDGGSQRWEYACRI